MLVHRFIPILILLQVFLVSRLMLILGLLLAEKSSLERLGRLEIHSLCLQCWLCLKHFFALVPDQAHLMHIQLDFILKYFECSQHWQGIPNPNLLWWEPLPELALLAWASFCPWVLIHPQYARDDASGIIQPKKVFFVFFYIEHDCTSNLNLPQQVKIPQDEKYFTILFVFLAHVILECHEVIFFVIVFEALSCLLLNLILLVVISVP